MSGIMLRKNESSTQEQEEWRGVIGLESRYEVSISGRVRSLPFSTIRSNGRPYTHAGGELSPAHRLNHQYVQLYYTTKKMTKCWVYRLVLESFVGPPPSSKHEANHIDGNPLNNHVTNLEWVTRRENIQHAIENKLHARGEQCGTSKLTNERVVEIRKLYASGEWTHRSLAKKFGVGKTTIGSVLTGLQWRHV